MRTIWRKELADYFNSTRFLILFCLILSVSLLITNAVGLGIRSALDRGQKDPHLFLLLFTTSGTFFSLVQFVAFFGPLVGIIMGFDAVNRERNEGTLAMLLSQPVHRDAIISGKFLAGLSIIAIVVLSIVLLISGMGMTVIGVVPTLEQVERLLLYMVLSVLYLGFWLGLSILASILFRSVGTSALASIATPTWPATPPPRPGCSPPRRRPTTPWSTSTIRWRSPPATGFEAGGSGSR